MSSSSFSSFYPFFALLGGFLQPTYFFFTLICYPLFLFDGAKVRRFFDSNKHFCVIVCEHSSFIDTYQRKAEISIFLLFPIKRS